MKIIKKLASNIHRYVLCALVSVFFWGWVFTLAGDAPRAKKLTVFTSVDAIDCAQLQNALADEMPDGISLVRVYPFRYAAFDTSEAESADIYLVTGEEAASMAEYLSPITDAEEGLIVDGAVIAEVLIPAGFAAENTLFSDTIESDVYICFGSRSVHTESLNGSDDDAALLLADKIKELFAQGGNL